jgi:hypothetical protein
MECKQVPRRLGFLVAFLNACFSFCRRCPASPGSAVGRGKEAGEEGIQGKEGEESGPRLLWRQGHQSGCPGYRPVRTRQRNQPGTSRSEIVEVQKRGPSVRNVAMSRSAIQAAKTFVSVPQSNSCWRLYNWCPVMIVTNQLINFCYLQLCCSCARTFGVSRFSQFGSQNRLLACNFSTLSVRKSVV